MEKSPDAFRTISEVAEWLEIQAHVLRFWESKFPQVKPVKRAGGRRYYRPADMLLLGGIKKLLHDDGLTIKGVQKIIREQGVDHVSGLSRSLDDDAIDATATAPNVVTFHSRQAIQDLPPDAAEPPVETAPQEDSAEEVITEEAPAPPVEDLAPETEEPEVAATPDPTDTPQDEAPEPAPQDDPEPAPPEQPALPSFLHRPPAPEPDPTPRPRVVEAADPPPESDMPYAKGALAHLANTARIAPDQVAPLTALAGELRALCGRISGQGPA